MFVFKLKILSLADLSLGFSIARQNQEIPSGNKDIWVPWIE